MIDRESGVGVVDRPWNRSTFRIALLALLGAFLFVAGSSASADAATRLASPGGVATGSCSITPCNVNYAITVADPADTISLANGTYDLANIQVPKELHFVGSSRANTIVGLTSGSPAVDTFELNDGADGSSFTAMTITARPNSNRSAIGTTAGATGVDDISITNVSITTAKGAGGDNGIGITAPSNDWTISNVLIDGFFWGLHANQANANNFTISGSQFDNNYYGGIYATRNLAAGTGGFTGLDLSNSTFNSNRWRGLYFEGLSNSTIDGVTVTNTGDGIAAGGGLPSGARALAINLKSGTFSNITVENSKFTGSVYEGVTVEVRGWTNDAGPYVTNPATLNGLTFTNIVSTNNGGPGFTIANQPTLLSPPNISASRIYGNGFRAGPGVHGVAKDSNGPFNGVFATYPNPSVDSFDPGTPVNAENN